jgi:hypothetical protein
LHLRGQLLFEGLDSRFKLDLFVHDSISDSTTVRMPACECWRAKLFQAPLLARHI